MAVTVNRHYAEVALETMKQLHQDLVEATRQAFPHFTEAEAKRAVMDACNHMGRNLTPHPAGCLCGGAS